MKNENITTIETHIESVAKLADTLGRLDLPNEQLKRSASEKIQIALRGFLAFSQAIDATDALEEACTAAIAAAQPNTGNNYRRYRSKSSGWGESCDEVKNLTPSIEYRLPNIEYLQALDPVLRDASVELARIESIWKAWRPCVKWFSDADWYKDNKRELLYGSREALSLLRLWGTGELSKNWGDQEHKIFGMQFRLTDGNWNKIRKVLRKLRIGIGRNVREKKGAAPSHAAGCRLIQRRYRHVDNSALARFQRVRKTVRHTMIGGFYAVSDPKTPLMARHIRLGFENTRIVQRWIEKRISSEFRCNPPAQTLEKPRQVNETDYVVRACWKRDELQTEFGYLFLRVGYGNCYHCPDVEFSQLENLARRVREILTAHAARPRYGAIKNSEERRKAIRQATADILRRLRRMPDAILTPEDSYGVQNCAPGTRDFMKRLEIDSNRITAADIAKRWRKASFVQRDLFSKVVDRVYNSVATE